MIVFKTIKLFFSGGRRKKNLLKMSFLSVMMLAISIMTNLIKLKAKGMLLLTGEKQQ